MLPVQFITHYSEHIPHEESAMLALKGGCKWIQLRIDNATDAEVEPIAKRLQKACREHSATFILYNRVELAKKIDADGVHLDKNDMSVDKARLHLGEGFIISGSANTFEDICLLKQQSADYICCGPYRCTTFNEEATPILGLDGYRHIIAQTQEEHIRIPLCAIGGIRMEDVANIMSTGMHGIAVSSMLLQSENPVATMQQLLAMQ